MSCVRAWWKSRTIQGYSSCFRSLHRLHTHVHMHRQTSVLPRHGAASEKAEMNRLLTFPPSSPVPPLTFPLPTMSFIPAVVRAAKRSQRLPLSSTRLSTPSSSRRFLATVGTEPKFTSPTSEHVAHLRSLLSSKSSLLSTFDESASAEELDGFNVDWMGKYKGQSRVVVKPKNTQEVADVMKYCYEQGIAIVPQGGNTGLVGMSILHIRSL
jgi:hypothetical protein